MLEANEGFYQQFGRQLRQARKAAGLSQADLAVALDLTRTSVTNIEKGRQQVLLHTFGRMLHVLKVTPIELLPADQAQPETTFLPRLNTLAIDEREFVERGLRQLGKEKHESSLGANSEDGKENLDGT